jgi:hypothetical protein
MLDSGAGGTGEPGGGGGRNIMAYFITLPTAPIALMLSPPYGTAAFCRDMARRPTGGMSAKG